MATRPVSTTVFATLTGPISEPVSTLDTNFSNLVAAVDDPLIASNVSGDTGTANTYVGSISPGPSVLDVTQRGLLVVFTPLYPNTGASTFNLNGFGAQPIIKAGGALSGGELIAGVPVLMAWTGASAKWALVNSYFNFPAFQSYLRQTGSTQWNAAPSNLQSFSAPPPTLVQGAGTVTNGGPGGAIRLIFASAHGLREGELVQISSTVTLPGNVAASTNYIVTLDAGAPTTEVNLYPVPVGWQYMVPLITHASPQGLTFGALLLFTTTGSGTLTVTPGWVAPLGTTRVKARGCGGGSGGNGGLTGGATADTGGGGGAGAFSEGWFSATPGTFYPMVVGAGSAGGATSTIALAGGATTFFGISVAGGAVNATSFWLSNPGGAAGTGGSVNIAGGDGQPGESASIATANMNGALGGASRYGGGAGASSGSPPTAGNARVPGSGGCGGYTNTVGGNGANGIIEVEW